MFCFCKFVVLFLYIQLGQAAASHRYLHMWGWREENGSQYSISAEEMGIEAVKVREDKVLVKGDTRSVLLHAGVNT